jgi:hypothetical protein
MDDTARRRPMDADDSRILRTPVTDESAWTGAELEKDLCWLHHLTPAHVDEIDRVIEGLRRNGKTLETVTREDFPLPTLGAFLEHFVRHDVVRRGFGMIRGLPRARYSDAEIGMLYWGLGFHMGIGVSQNPDGDLLGHVVSFGEDRNALNVRGYRTSALLKFHNDPSDVVGLLCLRKAKEGGLSSLVSGMTIYNIVLKEHPEYLPLLYRGFRFDRRDQNPHFLEPISRPIPIFSNVDGQLSIRYVRSIINAARIKLGQPLSDFETEALDFVESIATRPGIPLHMDFEEGDMQFANNYTVLHSRTAFVDYDEPERKRHLLRLWLKIPGIRKLAEDFIEYEESSGWSRREGILPYDAPLPKTQPTAQFA